MYLIYFDSKINDNIITEHDLRYYIYAELFCGYIKEKK